MSEIVNKVAASGLITIDLEEWYPRQQRIQIDIAPQLWQGLALKEKDYRDWVKNHDWQSYQNAYVAVHCSVDAIIPNWAFMLVTSALSGITIKTVFGSLKDLETQIFYDIISQLDAEYYRDKRIVVKGCGSLPIPLSAYTELVNKLQPVVKSIMYGEPCSTVPVFKR
jgi:hypothetical protein